MFRSEDIAFIRGRVAAHTGISLPEAVAVRRGEGLELRLEAGGAEIAAEDRNALARGFFLMARCVREGRRAAHIRQRRRIASCGVMLDCSRNAVAKPEAVERLIDQAAMLGMNLVLLYTEDTYEIPGQPYFGHLRGRYSQAELRALDAYAARYDIELMPCIQTLGHLEQFLQWEAAAALRDRPDILLIDGEGVYELLEAAIRGLRDCLRGRRIHIGMDEAHDVGLGRYLDRHGPCDRMELLRRHLERVTELCARYDFEPVMWSDMFYRLGSKTREYYDPDAVIPQSVIDAMPDVGVCYWDYYHTDADFYDRMLAGHERLGTPMYAGGIWTWSGFLPHVKRTRATMAPALRVCARRGVDTVFATMWGDDGSETNPFLALNQLPLFSEACWQGPDCPEAEVARMGECLTGLDDAAFQAFGAFYPDAGPDSAGKGLIWCDPLYPLLEGCGEDLEAAAERYRRAAALLEGYAGRLDCLYAALVFRVAAMKADWVREARTRYLAGDRAWLNRAAAETLPELHRLYGRLMEAHRALWERDMRRNGWEVLCLRYGGVSARLLDVKDEIERYLDGGLEAIVELEEAPLPAVRRTGQFFHSYASPSALQ